MERSSKLQTAFVMQLVIFFAVSSLFAGEGALTTKIVDKIRSSFEMDAHSKAMYNSITNNDISSLALNCDILHRHNEIFSHKIETKGITNQKKSGLFEIGFVWVCLP